MSARQRLAAVLTLFIGVTKSERHGVRRTDQGTTVLEVCQERRTVPGREGEIHGGGLAVWIRRRLVEVGVPIDEEQAEPAAPFEREHGAEKDRTIAAQNQRKLTGVKHAADRIGQPRTPVCDRACVESTGRRVTLGAVWQWFNPPGVPRVHAFRQPVLEQRVRQTIDSRRLQAKNGRRFDDGVTTLGQMSCHERYSLARARSSQWFDGARSLICIIEVRNEGARGSRRHKGRGGSS